MDSITQAVLGAAISKVALNQQTSNRFSFTLGAVLGTLPDLDIIASPWLNDIDSFVLHRSATHSLLLLPLVSLVIAWVLHYVNTARWQHNVSYWRWYALCCLVLVTHPVLDTFTSYGTQLLWPLTTTPFATSSIFIIDPLYTGLLIFGLFQCRKTIANPPKILIYCLALSSFYLLLGLGLKSYLKHQLVTYSQQTALLPGKVINVDVICSPFQILYWKLLIATEDGYAKTYVPLWGNIEELTTDDWLIKPHSPNFALVKEQLKTDKAFQKLRAFSQDLYYLHTEAGMWYYSDVRMGNPEISGSPYIFNFPLGTLTPDGHFTTMKREW